MSMETVGVIGWQGAFNASSAILADGGLGKANEINRTYPEPACSCPKTSLKF